MKSPALNDIRPAAAWSQGEIMMASRRYGDVADGLGTAGFLAGTLFTLMPNLMRKISSQFNPATEMWCICNIMVWIPAMCRNDGHDNVNLSDPCERALTI